MYLQTKDDSNTVLLKSILKTPLPLEMAIFGLFFFLNTRCDLTSWKRCLHASISSHTKVLVLWTDAKVAVSLSPGAALQKARSLQTEGDVGAKSGSCPPTFLGDCGECLPTSHCLADFSAKNK